MTYESMRNVKLSSRGLYIKHSVYAELRGNTRKWWLRDHNGSFRDIGEHFGNEALPEIEVSLHLHRSYTLGVGSVRLPFTVLVSSQTGHGYVSWDITQFVLAGACDEGVNRVANALLKQQSHNKEENNMTKVVDTIKNDAVAASRRVATQAFLQTMKPLFVKALSKSLRKHQVVALQALLRTPLGEAVFAHALSLVLVYLPTQDRRAATLATELRVSSITQLGQHLLLPLLGPLQKALANIDLPSETTTA